MADPDLRDRAASQRSLREAIDGLDAAPRRTGRKPAGRGARQLEALGRRVTPLRLTVLLAGLTALVLGCVLV